MEPRSSPRTQHRKPRTLVWYSQITSLRRPTSPVSREIGFLGVRCNRRAVPGGRPAGSEPRGAEGGEMRVYWELAKLGFRRASAYRAAAVSGAITNTFFGFLRAYIFSALYESRADVAGYTLADILAFTFIAQSMVTL